MLTDRLTLRPTQIAAIVEAVLAGASIHATAAEAGIDLADLEDAVQTYRTGGQDALQHGQDHAWFHALIEPTDWTTAETVFGARIAPHLDRLDSRPTNWWFLRKHPFWRLRIRTTAHHAAQAVLEDLTAAGVIAGWRQGIYEPEIAAFGGTTATTIVHGLFCADSRGVLDYTRHDPAPMGRRELSLLLIRALQHHARLDWFEAADVFDRVAQMRPSPPAADAARLQGLAGQMRPLLSLPTAAHAALFAQAGLLTTAGRWREAHAKAGQQLRDAADNGRLERGLRSVVAHIVIFHWNRLGLSAHAQGILAHAAATAILPPN